MGINHSPAVSPLLSNLHFVLCLPFSATLAESAEGPVMLGDRDSVAALVSRVKLFEDPGADLDINAALRLLEQGGFEAWKKPNLSLGYTDSAFWILVAESSQAPEITRVFFAAGPGETETRLTAFFSERLHVKNVHATVQLWTAMLLRRTWVRRPQRVAGGSGARRTNAGIVISVKLVQQRG